MLVKYFWNNPTLVRTATAASVVLATTSSFAREPALSLSLQDALKRAEDAAPNVKVSRDEVLEADARRVGAGLRFPVNPRVNIEGRPPVTGGTLHDIGYGATLDVPLDISGAPTARVLEAERGVAVAKSSVVLQARWARAMAWSSYVRTRIAEERIAESERALKNAERILEATKQRVTAGATGEPDQALAAVEVAEQRAAVERAKGAFATERMALREALDLPHDQELALTTPLASPPAAPAENQVVERALHRRPELGIADKRVQWLDASSERLNKEVFPRTSVYAGVDAAPVSPIFGFLGVSIDLPVAQRNQTARATTLAARDTEVHKKDILAKQIAREVAVARAGYEARRSEFEVLNTLALPSAERSVELVEVGWTGGRFDLFRLTTAQRELSRIRNLRLDALEATWIGFVTLDRVSGGLEP